MIYNIREADKFLNKLEADASSFKILISPDGTLCYQGSKSIPVTDFIAICDGKLWGRSGMIWLPSSSLPEKSVPLCMLSLKRLAIFLKDEKVDCISPKKEIDSGTSFLLCAKFSSGIRLLIADPSVGKQHLALTLCRDENGEAFCHALVRQFVQQRLPEQVATLDILFEGGNDREEG